MNESELDTSEFDIEFLAQKLSENPGSVLFARLADLYVAKNQSVEAMKLCEGGIKLFPRYYAGYIVLGKIHLALKGIFQKLDRHLKKRRNSLRLIERYDLLSVRSLQGRMNRKERPMKIILRKNLRSKYPLRHRTICRSKPGRKVNRTDRSTLLSLIRLLLKR